jgi:hypothetical protein
MVVIAGHEEMKKLQRENEPKRNDAQKREKVIQ